MKCKFRLATLLLLAILPILFAATQTRAATFTVNSTGDLSDATPGNGVCLTAAGNCTLRAAIEESNAFAGTDTIEFAIAGAGVKTLTPMTAYPDIIEAVTIDGWTQGGAGYNGVPLIQLNGTNTIGNGLRLLSSSSTVKGLIINRFNSYGILLQDLGGHTVQGCYIGTNDAGTNAQANGTGIYISSSNNTVGGTTAARRNIISGNTGEGIYFFGLANPTGNEIIGNYIGTNAAGDNDIENDVGVYLGEGATGNTIGGTNSARRNVISGNDYGVELRGASNNTISGNYIGTDATGAVDLGNRVDGVSITDGATGNTIGGTTDGARNIISGNSTGVEISGFAGVNSSGNFVKGNYIGTDATGTLDLGNSTGVEIYDSFSNTIGGTTAGERNVISGNSTGVKITGTPSTGNVVIGNYIGTDASGVTALGNTYGVKIELGATGNRIGGIPAGEANIIAYSLGNGVEIGGSTTRTNKIHHNSIHSNGYLGIDLYNGGSPDGVTQNDTDDADTGANNLQNFPVLTEAVNQGGVTDISGSLNSTPNNLYTIEFFSSPSCDSSGNGEGETYIGSIPAATDAGGDAAFNFAPATQLALGRFVTATVTRQDTPQDTSEFSECIQVVSPFPLVVTNTNDSGAGSLRQAILDANLIIGLETIRFLIPGAGVKTINLLSPLPTVTDAVIIDGRTQPGFSGLPLIELNGTNAGASADGLNITANGSTVRGLIINRFGGDGIELVSSNGSTITGNFIGTDATGTIDLGNGANGIYLNGSENNRVGGANPLARNLISGNNLNGIYIFNTVEIGNQILGNIIGTDITRSVALGNLLSGIYVNSAALNIIGGTNANAGNLISANGANGIRFNDAYGNQVKGNFIGTDGGGTLNLGNTLHGVRLEAASNDNLIGDGNTIAFNTDGINSGDLATGNSFRGNSIFSNLNLGIDLAPNGLTPNDTDDADTGANNLQNFPVLTNAFDIFSGTVIEGSLNSTANTSFTTDFFSSASCDSSGNGEGQTYIGSTTVLTDAGGNVNFSYSSTGQVAVGGVITATATRDVAPLDTSEFSACFAVVEGPGSLTFSATSYVANETAGTRTVTVNRTDGDIGTITVDYATSNGTATAGQDYTTTSGTLTFLNGETVKTFDVPIINDTIDEANETVSLTLSNASPNVGITPNATAVVTINDNDNAPQISIDDISIEEGNVGSRPLTFTVQLSNPSSSTVTLNYATADGTATGNSDYLPLSGLLNFAPLETSKTVSVTVLGDLVVEIGELFSVNLSNPTNATVSDNQGIGTIIDDDNAGRFSFSFVPYSGAEGTQVMATVSRTNGDAGTVTVDYSTSGGNAAPFSDYTPTSGTIIFNDGETSKTFMVNLLDDAAVEPTENFNVVLSNPIGGSSLGTPSVAPVNILDNDSGTLLTIGGEILKTDNTPLVGATVNLTGAQTASTTTNGLGQYSFGNLAPNGNYSVAPVAIGFTFNPINRQYNNLTANVTNANFTATAAPSRQLRIIGGNAAPTQNITTVIELVAQGDENSVGFSLNFDAGVLMNPSVVLNPDSSTASLIVNDSQAGSGKLGIILALPAGTSFTAGTKSLITVTFNTTATNLYSSPVTFGDIPTARETANTNASPLPTNYLDGAVTFAQGWEADLAPRFTGSNTGSITVADFTQVGRFAAGLDTNYQLNEFQRADCAPRVSLGNGAVTVSDYTQAGRYAANLDAATPAGGQYALSLLDDIVKPSENKLQDIVPTVVRVVNINASAGQQVMVSIETDAQGGENGFGFTLNYDSAKLSNPLVQLGSGVPVGTVLIPNTAQTGRVGVILGLPFGVGLTAGTRQFVTIRFDVTANAPGGQSALTLGDVPVVREVSDVNANVLMSTFTDGAIIITGPTAASVSIGGRVLTADGRGISGAQVSMTDTLGNVRFARTNPFGYYRFDEVPAGEIYIFNVNHKLYQFTPQVLTIYEATDGLNFTALP